MLFKGNMGCTIAPGSNANKLILLEHLKLNKVVQK